MRRIWSVVTAVALPAALAGCTAAAAETHRPAEDGAADAVADGEALWGRSFVAQRVTGDAETESLLAGTEFTVSFDDGSIGAVADCNHMGGTVEPDGGRLAVTELFSTEMACEEPAMAVDTWLIGFLESAPEYTLDGDTLTLTSEGVTVELTESP
ncbi:META domain-containing protein [Stackebrandtia albiflava]|uniref:META domain-containing protein n=1 Tax=Stackebrandtia albiflava TaxID=406432 RepID=UPI0011BE2EDF